MSRWHFHGLSDVEKQTAIHYLAMANSPMYLGGDLTKLDKFRQVGLHGMTNFIVVDQSGLPAVQVTGGPAARLDVEASGRQYLRAVYNLKWSVQQKLLFRWSDLGFRTPWSARCVEPYQPWSIGGCIYHDPRWPRFHAC